MTSPRNRNYAAPDPGRSNELRGARARRARTMANLHAARARRALDLEDYEAAAEEAGEVLSEIAEDVRARREWGIS